MALEPHSSEQSENTVARERDNLLQFVKVMSKHLGPRFDKHIPHGPGERQRVWPGVRGSESQAGCRQ